MNSLSMKLSLSRTLVVLVLAVVAGAAPARAEGEGGIRWTNGLVTDDLRFNALTANPRANPRIAATALRTETYALGTGDMELREQLGELSARKFMNYLVSCALAPGQTVQWTDRLGNPHLFEGRLGLCPAWHTGPASEDCQRWVSACVLARNNADGKRVLFSGRGQKPSDTMPFVPRPTVETDLFHRYSHNRVASMQECSPHEIGIHRNCGFKPERVGQCTPGARVQVGAGGVPPDFSCSAPPLGETLSGTMMLRVCEGFGACNEAKVLAQSAITCSLFRPAVSFTCPASGVFSVMSGSRNSANTGEVRVQVGNATYPAAEQQLFTHREGAFWGTLFGPGALALGIDVWVDNMGVVHKDVNNVRVTGSLYPKMFACQAPEWEREDAYANARLCALPGENCVAQVLGRCNAVVTAGSYTGRQCQIDNATGFGDYGMCVNPAGEAYPQVVTPHLSQPCDNVSDAFACALQGTPPGGIP
ncbi:hypothetical protein [Hyalangium sp.]|uniref:hypothetical protein n=1 Tax=Hyalangium sp. TaxID=2028555 RepID=UPI002D642ED4|nr:hypothetical protein [Hyalangium sp.]HYH99680.1 hypothetical protein [Hyalangium sp.]